MKCRTWNQEGPTINIASKSTHEICTHYVLTLAKILYPPPNVHFGGCNKLHHPWRSDVWAIQSVWSCPSRDVCQDDLTYHHLMIIINHEKVDSSPMLGAFQRIWGIDSHQDSISLHVCQSGQDNVKLHYKVMDQYWFSPSFICEIGLKDENTPKHRNEVGSEHTLMLRARPWFVWHPHQGLVETPHVATRVALVANHHFCRPVLRATYLAMERWTSEVGLGVFR